MKYNLEESLKFLQVNNYADTHMSYNFLWNYFRNLAPFVNSQVIIMFFKFCILLSEFLCQVSNCDGF